MNLQSRWPQVKVGDVVEATQYGTGVKANDDGLGLPVLRMNNIAYNGTLDLRDIKHVELPEKGREQYTLRRGDVLFNRTNSQELVGKTAVWGRDEPYVFAGYLVRLRLDRSVAEPAFVAAWFNTPEMKLLLRVRAKPSINMSNINAAEVLKFPLVLPPLAEQRRIAEILDRAEALRAKRRAALAQLDTLTQSIFLDLFGDPVSNPRNHDVASLGELIKLKSGEFLSSDTMNSAGKFPVLGGNGINGYHDRFLFEDSKVVIGRVGAYCGCVHQSPPKAWVTDNALYVSEQSPRLHTPYLVHALLQANLNQYASQSGQPLVSGSRIYPVRILVPPGVQQEAFARGLDAVERLKAAQRRSLAELDALFASLQHRAFRGEL